MRTQKGESLVPSSCSWSGVRGKLCCMWVAPFQAPRCAGEELFSLLRMHALTHIQPRYASGYRCFNLPWQRKPTHTSPCQGIPVCQNTVSVALQSYSKGHLLHSPIFPSVSSLTIFKVNQLQRQGCAKLFHRQTLLCFIPGALHTPNTTFLCTFTAITGFQSESSSNSTSHRSSFPHYTSVVPIRVCWKEMYECCISAQ